jgi:hypothetical protein
MDEGLLSYLALLRKCPYFLLACERHQLESQLECPLDRVLNSDSAHSA